MTKGMTFVSRLIVSILASLGLVSAAALPATAAPNKHKKHHKAAIRPNIGTFTGTLDVGVHKVITLKVSGHGTKGDLRLLCNGATVPHHVSLVISNGAFSATQQIVPHLLAWGISGHFLSTTTATAHFNGQGVCDGKSGNISLTHS
jgi:hypothetical protein